MPRPMPCWVLHERLWCHARLGLLDMVLPTSLLPSRPSRRRLAATTRSTSMVVTTDNSSTYNWWSCRPSTYSSSMDAARIQCSRATRVRADEQRRKTRVCIAQTRQDGSRERICDASSPMTALLGKQVDVGLRRIVPSVVAHTLDAQLAIITLEPIEPSKRGGSPLCFVMQTPSSSVDVVWKWLRSGALSGGLVLLVEPLGDVHEWRVDARVLLL